jgi:hypothetical protein
MTTSIKSTDFVDKYTNMAAKMITKFFVEGDKYLKKQKEANQSKGTEKSTATPSTRNLNVTLPKKSKAEQVLDSVNISLTVITTVSGTAATLLAPLSIASGLYSLGKAQNVKGREAHHKAMAVDGAIDFLSLGNGERFQPIKNYPTWQEAAKGQGCYGQNASLSSSFHSSSEKTGFIKHYKKTLGFIKRMQSTPAGRRELKDFIKKYKHFKLKNQKVSPHIYFLENK